jgi:beta-carotene hydroxylase
MTCFINAFASTISQPIAWNRSATRKLPANACVTPSMATRATPRVTPSPAPKNLSRRELGLPHLAALGADLQQIMLWQRWIGPLLPLLTLALFSALYALHYYPLLPLVLVLHFIVAVRFTHDLVHGTAGMSARATDWALFGMSVLMLLSSHAFRIGHLHHHSHCLEGDDFEGSPARLSLLQVLVSGPLYIPRYWWQAYTLAKSQTQKRWMLAELGAAILLIVLAICVLPWTELPAIYLGLVWLGSWFFPITTAWLPHYQPHQAVLGQARTLRGKIIPALLCNLPYHLEHHLYPQVPSYNLARLAEQLDPHFARMGVTIPQVY